MAGSLGDQRHPAATGSWSVGWWVRHALQYTPTVIIEALDVRDSWVAAGKRVAAATVVRTWGSSPWPAGSRFLVSSDGETYGSVSGGCVEEDLRLRALRVLETGAPEQVTYGVSNDDAFEVGLACGGTIEVFVQPW